MEIGLNLLDLALLVALAFALLRGFRQGALSQVAAFGGAAIGLVLGAFGAPALAGLAVGQPGITLALLTLGFLLVAVFIGQGFGLAIGMRLRRAAVRAGIGAFDRGVGVLVGATGLIVVVWLLTAVLAQGPAPAVAQQVQQSRLVTALDDALPPPPDVFGRVAGYLDQQGFPQVFSGIDGGITAPPVPPTRAVAVQSAAAAGQPSTVQVQATGCGGISSGSGFVTSPGIVVSNAHVVAGAERVVVRDPGGEREAAVIGFDPELDLAVLAVPGLEAPSIGWTTTPSAREVEGATMGFPGGQRDMVVKPATVRSRGEAVGRDIYGRGLAPREILTLSSAVQRGDSGGPFVTAEGAQPDVAAAVARNTSVSPGDCRF